MKYFLKPWKHQEDALNEMRDKNEYGLFFDMGTGKTLVTVNALREKYYRHKRVLRTLIICPVAVCRGWQKEFNASSSKNVSDRLLILSGSGNNRLKQFKKAIEKEENSIFVINFEGLSIKDLYHAIAEWSPEAVVVDESQRIKNHAAKRSKLCWMLGDGALYRYILSGTPILNSPMDIFSQYRFLDGGQSFGDNYFSFRQRYFYDKNQGMASHKHFPDWRAYDGTEKIFNEKIYSKAMRVMKSKCLDLPPFIRQTVYAPLGKQQQKAYDQMRLGFIAFINDEACMAELAITKSLRMQQIISGHAVVESGNDKSTVEFDDIPRLKILSETVEALPKKAKFIIWACFKSNYSQILSAMDKINIKSNFLIGGMSYLERADSIDSFVRDENIRCLIANPASAGVGVDGLQVANYAIYYSRNFNLEYDLQSNDRIYRGGSEQHSSVTRIDIVAENTIDELIVESLKKKHTSAEAILAWRQLL